MEVNWRLRIGKWSILVWGKHERVEGCKYNQSSLIIYSYVMVMWNKIIDD